MRSVTLAVIFSGLLTYGTANIPPSTPIYEDSYIPRSASPIPLVSDPDDDEDDKPMMLRSARRKGE